MTIFQKIHQTSNEKPSYFENDYEPTGIILGEGSFGMVVKVS